MHHFLWVGGFFPGKRYQTCRCLEQQVQKISMNWILDESLLCYINLLQGKTDIYLYENVTSYSFS